MGIGIGLIIGGVITSFGSFNKIESKNRIEEKARELGMHYKDDCKVIFEGEVKK